MLLPPSTDLTQSHSMMQQETSAPTTVECRSLHAIASALHILHPPAASCADSSAWPRWEGHLRQQEHTLAGDIMRCSLRYLRHGPSSRLYKCRPNRLMLCCWGSKRQWLVWTGQAGHKPVCSPQNGTKLELLWSFGLHGSSLCLLRCGLD